MRTAVSPKTGATWRLCDWNAVCQMPVRHASLSESEGSDVYCRWHRWVCNAPVLAQDRGAFQEFLAWINTAYPGESKGWWGRSEEELWPVVQGVMSIWDVEREVA